MSKELMIESGNNLINKFMDQNSQDYHLDWRMLMPVLEKIEEDEHFATMIYVNPWDNRGKYCFSIYRELDENRSLRNVFVEYASHSKIESVWTGVVEYISLKNGNLVPRSQEDFNKNYLELRRRIDNLQYPNT